MSFPQGFVWGAATSSYQIEGAAVEDGRGPSIWDTFCRRPGAISTGDVGDIACDHYHRLDEDVALMSQLGLRAYRFSIAWPRVMPGGDGAVNAAGLDFYDRLVDALLAAKIEPYATLFHWDLPQALQDRSGGWLGRATVDAFARYTEAVVDRLSDRVHNWMTLNEPQVFIHFGHAEGKNAPGLKLPLPEQLRACHHALLAHGRAVQVIRARSKQPAHIGWAPIGFTKVPATGSQADIEAARTAMFTVIKRDLWNAAWYSDPVFFGRYPETGLQVYGAEVPREILAPKDLAEIHQPIDFIGLNIYEGERVSAGSDGHPVVAARPPGHPTTAFRWPVEPESLYWGPRFTFERYHAPVYITENGLSNVDWVYIDGRVHDPQRIDYTRRYLRELRRAVADGVDVRGYFHWSLLDNFEWAEGFKERFGLVHVDFATGRRTPKDSAHWYAHVIATNGEAL